MLQDKKSLWNKLWVRFVISVMRCESCSVPALHQAALQSVTLNLRLFLHMWLSCTLFNDYTVWSFEPREPHADFRCFFTLTFTQRLYFNQLTDFWLKVLKFDKIKTEFSLNHYCSFCSFCDKKKNYVFSRNVLKTSSTKFYLSNNACWEICQQADRVHLKHVFYELTELTV